MQAKTQTSTEPLTNPAVGEKIQKLREIFADAPQMAKTALENKIRDLASHASEPRSQMESAGRTGSRQGMVSELTLILPFAPGGAQRLRALLQAQNGNFDDADKVGTVHDMRFVFIDDTKLLFATAYDGEWDPYIDDSGHHGHRLLCFRRLAGDSQRECYERLDRQPPDHRRRLVRRQSGSDGGGDPTARTQRKGVGRIPRQDQRVERTAEERP